MSSEIMEEYTRVFEILSVKYPPINLSDFVELILSEAKFFKPIQLSHQVCADPDDDKFIACALSSKADCIITGDNKLLAVSGYLCEKLFVRI